MKTYKAVFFDWDGTAVISRKAPADAVILPMKQLLLQGVKLVIVSGTTYENIAGGQIHSYFTPVELKNLYLGLGRGAYNYCFDETGMPYLWKDRIPPKADLLAIHDVCYDLHRHLLETYCYPTDIVFSRPNYCKIDLMVENNRGDQLFFQENELDSLKNKLAEHHFTEGIPGLIRLAEKTAAQRGLTLSATTDAKYLEVGLSRKSDNVDSILSHFMDSDSILPRECAFWGDEYIGLDQDIFGSDSFMITQLSKEADFFDVSPAQGIRPDKVQVMGGGVDRFLKFLYQLAQ